MYIFMYTQVLKSNRFLSKENIRVTNTWLTDTVGGRAIPKIILAKFPYEALERRGNDFLGKE